MAQNQLHSSIRFGVPGGELRTVMLDRVACTIGSQRDDDIRHAGLLMQHAELRFELGDWVICRMNPKAVMSFHGHSVDMKKLNDGDWLDLGGIELHFAVGHPAEPPEIPAPDSPRDSELSFCLVVLKGRDRGAVFRLKPGEYILGRPFESDGLRIGLEDPFVSRDHVRMMVLAGRVILEDMGSSNGTWIDGRAIVRAEIRPDAIIRIGRTVIGLRSGTPEDLKVMATRPVRGFSLTGFGWWPLWGVVAAAIAAVLAVWFLAGS